ncbi:MAG: hypothetical protein KGD64_05025 [Candidatus Heimdallarchaeota archaeon]|nr:hypothetical protein [Candidatus Heimdallarchaeota archaeon]
MIDTLDKEEFIQAISAVKRYESYRVQKLWGIALICIPTFTILFIILSESINLRDFKVIYIISNLVMIVFIASIFCYYFIQTKKMKINDSKIVASYYTSLGISLLLIFYFFAINLLLADYIKPLSSVRGPSLIYTDGSLDFFPFVLFGYNFSVGSDSLSFTYIYWGDNFAFLISYFLLRSSIKKCKFRELLYSLIFLFFYDLLTYVLDVFVFKTAFLGSELAFLISGVVVVICGIYSIRRAYKTLNETTYLYQRDIND